MDAGAASSNFAAHAGTYDLLKTDYAAKASKSNATWQYYMNAPQDGKSIQAPTINIRGTTSIGTGGSALVLIDGVPVANAPVRRKAVTCFSTSSRPMMNECPPPTTRCADSSARCVSGIFTVRSSRAAITPIRTFRTGGSRRTVEPLSH